jgi:hypothetical protein
MNHPNQPTFELFPRQQGPEIFKETLGHNAVMRSREVAQTTADANWIDDTRPQVSAISDTLEAGYTIYTFDRAVPFSANEVGRQAVSSTLRQASESSRRQINLELDAARGHLFDMSDGHQKLIDRYCMDGIVPEDIHRLMLDPDSGKPPDSYYNWLRQEADYDQLLQFLEWHVGTIEQLQIEPHVVEAIEYQKEGYAIDVLKGIGAGWLHEDADSAVMAVDGVTVYIGDVFDHTLEDAGGYHERGKDHVVISGTSRGVFFLRPQMVVKNIDFAGKHEFNHAVLGRLDLIGGRWMDEAVTEHIVQVFEHGQDDVMHPDKRDANRPQYAYDAELKFMADVLSLGADPVRVQAATLAYSEKGQRGNYKLYLANAINSSWAKKVLTEGEASVPFLDGVNHHIGNLERQIKRANLQNHQKDANNKLMTKAEIQTQAVFQAHLHLLNRPRVFLRPWEFTDEDAISS